MLQTSTLHAPSYYSTFCTKTSCPLPPPGKNFSQLPAEIQELGTTNLFVHDNDKVLLKVRGPEVQDRPGPLSDTVLQLLRLTGQAPVGHLRCTPGLSGLNSLSLCPCL